jgi:hypothetical protein
MKKRIHWNLKIGGLVVRNWPNLVGDMENPAFYCLKNCTFVVRKTTREKIRSGEQRSVHAWVQGEFCGCGQDDGSSVRYNPHRDMGFTEQSSGKVLSSAAHVAVRALGTGKGAGYSVKVRDAK